VADPAEESILLLGKGKPPFLYICSYKVLTLLSACPLPGNISWTSFSDVRGSLQLVCCIEQNDLTSLTVWGLQPAIWIAHSDIASVEFARVGGGSSTFDMYIHCKDDRVLEFRNLSRSDFAHSFRPTENSYLFACPPGRHEG